MIVERLIWVKLKHFKLCAGCSIDARAALRHLFRVINVHFNCWLCVFVFSRLSPLIFESLVILEWLLIRVDKRSIIHAYKTILAHL